MSEKDNALAEEAKTEKIVLTLNDEAETEEKEEVTAEEISKVDFDESKLSDEEKQMVADFAEKIDIMDATTILQYGASAQNKVADFSDNALKNVKAADIGDINDVMTDLVGQLKGFDVDEKDGFLTK